MTDSVEKVARAMADAAELDWGALPENPDAACGHGMPEGCRSYWRTLAQAALSAIPAEAEVVACPECGGHGETFTHADDCYSDSCALAGGMDDCLGQVVSCPTCDEKNAAIPAEGEVVAWMFSRKSDAAPEIYLTLDKAHMDQRYWTETPLVRQSALTAAHARIAELEALVKDAAAALRECRAELKAMRTVSATSQHGSRADE